MSIKPFINPRATEFLESILLPDWKVFEWGSGHSTVFFAARVALIVSVEHNSKWARDTAGRLNTHSLEADLNFVPLILDGWREYVAIIGGYSDEFFDLIFIDGKARFSCLRHAIPKVKPGGYIMLDDTERYCHRELLGQMLDNWERREIMWRKGGPVKPLSKTTFWRKPCSC